MPTAGLARFKQPSHPELVQSSSSSLPAQFSPPVASPEPADVHDSSEASESSIMQEMARWTKWQDFRLPTDLTICHGWLSL